MMYLKIFFVVLIVSPLNFVFAGDMEWSGFYRIEGYRIDKSELSSNGNEKSYGLHHLVLKPKIVAADSLTIHSRFDIFNQLPMKEGAVSNNQMGTVWGSGVSTDGLLNTTSENQQAANLEVSQLYMTFTQEFGSLIVGRSPLHFGLGMTHNSGDGMFDHWYDTRDLLGYRILVGNLYFFPMLAKANEGDLHNTSNEAHDWLGHVQYKNPDTGLEMGLFYWSRSASQKPNDLSETHDPSETNDNDLRPLTGKYKVKTLNFYFKRKMESFNMGVEVATQSGSTGRQVDLSGTGVAIELDWTPQKTSAWSGGINLGYASGDDPTTTNKYEGFIFDRNYDIAFLMFNHPLGTADYLRTTTVTGRTNFDVVDVADVEAISNVTYLSPHLTYRLSDSWSIDASLTAGWLNTDPLDTGVSRDLGYELDFSFNFSPNNRVTWVNGLGILLPGEAFKGGSNNFDTDLSLGLLSRAAIRF